MSDFYNKKIDFKAIKIDEKLSRVKKQKKILQENVKSL